MAELLYSATLSLDGFIAGPGAFRSASVTKNTVTGSKSHLSL